MDSNSKEQTKKVSLVNDDAVQQIDRMIRSRNKFYSDSLRFLAIVWYLAALALLSIIIVIIYTTITTQRAWYIPAKPNGQVIKVENLQVAELDGKPIPDQEIVDWVLKAIPSIYNYNYLNDKGNLRDVIEFFTPEGFREYSIAFQDARNLESIQKGKSAILGVGCGNNTDYIVRQGIKKVQGYPVYVWELKIPMITRNISPQKKRIMKGILDIRLQRVPQLVSRKGIAIWQFIFIVKNKDVFSDDGQFSDLCEKYF